MKRPIQVLWDALEQNDCSPRGPEHKFTAQCPAHEDRSPSLTCAEGRDGRALVFCWAGCELPDVVAAVGLELSDLFADDKPREYRRPLARKRAAVVLSSADRVGAVLDGFQRSGLRWEIGAEIGVWRAECPHHTGELSVWLIDRVVHAGRENEAPLLFCAAGCSQRQILSGLVRDDE